MPEINLKDHYPDAHQQDCFIEVTQEIFEVMHEMVRREKAHLRQVCRYHAQHSLDNPYALLKKGSVQHLKVGRSYRIPKAHLLTYLIGFAPGSMVRA